MTEKRATLLKKDSENDFDRIQFGDKTYFLEEVIGQTNASRVYKGYLENFPEEKFALKVVLLNPEANMDDLGTYCGLEERVSTYQNIVHEKIARLHDFFYLDTGVTEMPVVVRDYVAGESLQEQIDSGKICSPEEALDIFSSLMEISDYLETSAAREIVVRDVKPGNIIINGDAEPHLTDLELCTSSGQATTGGRGTIAYMCPEQLVGGNPTSMWDRYSIAKTMEHLLTGKEPEHGVSVNLPNGINVSSKVGEILQRMTAKEPLERYRNAKEVIAELNLKTSESNEIGCNNVLPAVVHNGSLATVPKQLALISKYCDKVDLEEEEKKVIGWFLQYAHSQDASDTRIGYLARALRLQLEARYGFTKKEEFMNTVKELYKQLDHDLVKADESKIVMVNPASEPVEVLHIYGPDRIYLDYLKPGFSVDCFIKHHNSYRKGENLKLRDKYRKKKAAQQTVAVATCVFGCAAGAACSMIGGIALESLLLAMGGLAGTAGFGAATYNFDIRYNQPRLEREFQRENAKLSDKDPRQDYSYNLPSTLIRAFLPEYNGEEE